MAWFKWDEDYLDHPQVAVMGWEGRVYFWLLCMQAKKRMLNGTVPAAYNSASYMATRLPGIGREAMENGRAQTVESDLVEEADGDLTIDGWERWQLDPKAAARQRDYRAKKMSQSVTRESRVTNGDIHPSSPPPHSPPPLTPQSESEISDAKASSSTEVDDLFQRWKTITKQSNLVKFTPKRRKKIQARLKDSTADEIIQAFEGCASSPFHMGNNDEKKMHTDILLICRSREDLERFIGYATRGEAHEPETTKSEDGIPRHANGKPIVGAPWEPGYHERLAAYKEWETKREALRAGRT